MTTHIAVVPCITNGFSLTSYNFEFDFLLTFDHKE